MPQRIIIGSGISSYFGWGIHGLNLALNWATDPDIEAVGALPIDPKQIVVDALRTQMLRPFLARSARFQANLEKFANRDATVKAPMIAAFGNGFKGAPAAHKVELKGQPTIAAIVFETPLEPDAIARGRAFPLIVTASTWNERVLRAYGLDRVRTVFEGVDASYFHPAPRLGVFKDRFAIYSGGKAEFRKAQDIVLAAFKIFAERHAEAVLIAAWNSPWPRFAQSLDSTGLAAPVVFDGRGNLDVRAWVAANGIPAERVVILGPMPNTYVAPVLREMDVAIFPNRVEGGTNLVAMECMACGVPVILSRNTGHVDLIEYDNCFPLDDQRQEHNTWPGIDEVPGWGESEVGEVVERLEQVFSDSSEAKRRGLRGAETLAARTWAAHARQMKEIVFAGI
jgi:glycosyltransferase involved in cell wall biosynthesis